MKIKINPEINLLQDIKTYISTNKSRTVQTINSGLVMTYWLIGRMILKNIIQKETEDDKTQIVATLSKQLNKEYGRGFSESNLLCMVKFAEVFPEQETVTILSRYLTWSHFIEVITIKDSLKRDFYAAMSKQENWNIQTLKNKIESMLFERTMASRNPSKFIQKEMMTLREKDKVNEYMIFTDPHILDLFGLEKLSKENNTSTASI